MELEKLESLALAVQDWSLTRAWLDPEDEGVSHVGGDTGDDDPLLVMTLDTGDYFQPQDALPLASFYAAVSPQAVLDLIAQIKDLEKRLALQTRVVESYEAQAEETEAPSADQLLDEDRKAVDLEARFTAQHQFLRWNRELQTPLVARAFEYAAFGKAVDLYQANLHKIAPLCPVSTEDLLHAIWVLMGECESKADNEDDRLLKHQVEGFYRMYGKATGTSLKPRWIERSEAASAKEAALRATLLERTPTEFQADMAKYLNEGATVTVSPQNEDPSIGKYAICVKDTDFWITCCETEAEAHKLISTLGLTLAKKDKL